MATISDNLAGLPRTLVDPLGFGVVGASADTVAADVGTGASVFTGLRNGFTGGPLQAYAYLLFVLLYLPCVATFGAMTREMGLRYTLLAVLHIGVTAWSISTLFYQLTVGGSIVWIVLTGALLASVAVAFWVIGDRDRAAERRLAATPASLRTGLLHVGVASAGGLGEHRCS